MQILATHMEKNGKKNICKIYVAVYKVYFFQKLYISHIYLISMRVVKVQVTAFEPTALLAERVQNISIYTVYIDMFCTRSAKSAVGSKAVTPKFDNLQC